MSYDPSQIILIRWYGIILTVENSCLICFGNSATFFSVFFDKLKVQKNSIYLKYFNVNIIIFDQFHALLLNKSINFLKIKSFCTVMHL